MMKIEYRKAAVEPMEFVPVQTSGRPPYPSALASRIMVDVIHDGDVIPDEFLIDSKGQAIGEDVFREHYVRERDWGASIVAERLATRLMLPGFFRVTTARVLVDFGRFPGSTDRKASHLRRFAINYPFSKLLGFSQKMKLLEDHYDRISDYMDQHLRSGLIKIAIHTYDRCNPNGTVRPQVSLVTRALGSQQENEAPHGIFDPLYPDVLGEFTADRILRDRISLTLEKANIPVAHNFPYLLPEGSTEVRHQVWAFFSYLRRQFEAANPGTVGRHSYEQVWDMLLDTNLRNSTSETLRAYIHMFRRPPKGLVREFHKAEVAYRHIERHLKADEEGIINEYRYSDLRPNSLGIEVRKDLVWELDEENRPARLRPEPALRIADTIADAVIRYLNEDRTYGIPEQQEFQRTDPWYASGNAPDPFRVQ